MAINQENLTLLLCQKETVNIPSVYCKHIIISQREKKVLTLSWQKTQRLKAFTTQHKVCKCVKIRWAEWSLWGMFSLQSASVSLIWWAEPVDSSLNFWAFPLSLSFLRITKKKNQNKWKTIFTLALVMDFLSLCGKFILFLNALRRLMFSHHFPWISISVNQPTEQNKATGA